MDKGLKDFNKELFRKNSRKLVGRLCKNIEVLQNQPNCDKQVKDFLELQKSLLKEIVYEEFRDLRNAITFYLEGRSYTKLPIYTPTEEDSSK